MNRLQSAYELVLPSLLAIPAREARVPRVDVAAVSAALLASLPGLEPALPALAALPGLPHEPTLELPTRILALVQAQAAHAATPPSGHAAGALLKRGSTVRRLLLRSALALADFDKLPSEPITAIRNGRGHGDRAMDLLGLSSLYKNAWSTIEGHTAVPFELVLEAAHLGDAILTAIGQGKQARARASEATLMRNRAFDLAERVRLAAVWAEAGGERGRTGERWARVEGGRELQPRGPRANRERETVTRSFLTKPTAEASRECRATAGVAPEPRPGQPKPRAARCGLVLAALTVVVAAACHDDDRRSERELCVSAARLLCGRSLRNARRCTTPPPAQLSVQPD